MIIIDKSNRTLSDRFMDLVAQKKYKYEAALMTKELLNSVEPEEDELDAQAEAVVDSSGFLGREYA